MIRQALFSTVSALVLVAGLSLPAPAHAQENAALTPAQADAVRKVVRDYLMENPEVIADAIEALREKMRSEAENEALKTIERDKDSILNNTKDPVLGNADGDLVMVEFFDYNCTYCKMVTDPLLDAVKSDGKVKVVLKELPILSQDSLVAARIALAAQMQGKYEAVHRAFMKNRGKLDEATALKLAVAAGADEAKLKTDMVSKEVDAIIRANIALAQSLEVNSTPTFIAASKDGKAARIIQGALDPQTIRQLFDAIRRDKAK